MTEWIKRTDPVGGNIAIFSRKPLFYSVTQNAVETGSKTFTVQAGLDFGVGDYLSCEPLARPLNFMIGIVTAYGGTTLTLNVIRAIDGGTFSNWQFVDVTPLYLPTATRSMQRLQWHTAHALVSTTPALTQSVSFTVPAQALSATYNNVFPLFAHGLGSPHEVDGRLLNFPTAGSNLPIVGSVPFWLQQNGGLNNGFGAFLEIGCTDTHVVAIVDATLALSGTTMPATTLTVEASVYDFNTSGAMPAGNPALPLVQFVPGQYCQFGRGRIDTRRRYPRRVDSGGDTVFSTNQTMTVVGNANTGARPAGATSGSYAQNEVGTRWRYSCAGYVQEQTRGWNGSTTNGGTANANFVRVKK